VLVGRPVLAGRARGSRAEGGKVDEPLPLLLPCDQPARAGDACAKRGGCLAAPGRDEHAQRQSCRALVRKRLLEEVLARRALEADEDGDHRAARRDELSTYRDHLAAALRTTTPQLPSPEQLAALCAEIDRIIAHGSPDVVKQLFGELIDRVETTREGDAIPYFRVPDMDKPGPTLARACNGTQVGIRSQDVELRGLEPLTSGLQSRRSTN
jgi:hypothetical protein